MISNNNRLHDVVHVNQRIYLVFEYLEMDLKEYLDNKSGGKNEPLNPYLVKVCD